MTVGPFLCHLWKLSFSVTLMLKLLCGWGRLMLAFRPHLSVVTFTNNVLLRPASNQQLHLQLCSILIKYASHASLPCVPPAQHRRLWNTPLLISILQNCMLLRSSLIHMPGLSALSHAGLNCFCVKPRSASDILPFSLEMRSQMQLRQFCYRYLCNISYLSFQHLKVCILKPCHLRKTCSELHREDKAVLGFVRKTGGLFTLNILLNKILLIFIATPCCLIGGCNWTI